jgi:hypothetical protein
VRVHRFVLATYTRGLCILSLINSSPSTAQVTRAFILKQKASESTTKVSDESISSSDKDGDDEEFGDDEIILVTDDMITRTLSTSTSPDYEDIFTIDGDDSIIINAARVIDDVENADAIDFRRFRMLNLEEKLEIIGIDTFRRRPYRNYVYPKKKKRKRMCKYATCYSCLFRFPSFLDDRPLVVKGLVLVSLILLAISFVIIVAALLVDSMLDDTGTYTEIENRPESIAAAPRDFDTPSSFEEFIPQPQASQAVSQESPPTSDHIMPNADKPRSPQPPSPWVNHAAEEQPINKLDTADTKSRNEPFSWLVLEEPVTSEHGDEVVNSQQQQVNNKTLSTILHSTDEESNEIPEYKANIFLQGRKALDPLAVTTTITNPETIATGPHHQPVSDEKQDAGSPFIPWKTTNTP